MSSTYHADNGLSGYVLPCFQADSWGEPRMKHFMPRGERPRS